MGRKRTCRQPHGSAWIGTLMPDKYNYVSLASARTRPMFVLIRLKGCSNRKRLFSPRPVSPAKHGVIHHPSIVLSVGSTPVEQPLSEMARKSPEVDPRTPA